MRDHTQKAVITISDYLSPESCPGQAASLAFSLYVYLLDFVHLQSECFGFGSFCPARGPDETLNGLIHNNIYWISAAFLLFFKLLIGDYIIVIVDRGRYILSRQRHRHPAALIEFPEFSMTIFNALFDTFCRTEHFCLLWRHHVGISSKKAPCDERTLQLLNFKINLSLVSNDGHMCPSLAVMDTCVDHRFYQVSPYQMQRFHGT